MSFANLCPEDNPGDGEDMQGPHSRIRLARRYLNISQSQLALAIGVQRSAVSHWESSQGKNPTLSNLRKIAETMAVHFEWLATGRGPMSLSEEFASECVPTAHALLVEDEVEMRMIQALRSTSLANRLALVEFAEQLATLRTSRASTGFRRAEVTAA